jgi:hypothetical protein
MTRARHVFEGVGVFRNYSPSRQSSVCVMLATGYQALRLAFSGFPVQV